ncbi:hypothetical protein [Cystobacter ferrugineus]|uniref:Uncharacterized protein n=1 Tax=Cystobacter ferrugineus TaxID=83449 RepID=A0A1L9BAK4_9BACT|nr:hypothetical protein [Cystobacter ferrugineus]OJH39223.1 hypothetical protein BON30_16970 [Cystobacter ferrugineus]
MEWWELVHALSKIFDLSENDIGLLDVDDLKKPRPPVLVEWIERESGFRLDLTFYIGVEVPSKQAGMALACRLAEALGQEILTNPPEDPDGAMSSPDSWVLALPTGEIYVVRQINPESDAVEIDRAPERMKRLRLPLMN